MKINCPTCLRTIKLKQKRMYHAGFSNLGFLYCNTCTSVLEFGVYNPHYTKIVGDKHPWSLNQKEKRNVENHLRPCPCGGKFEFDLEPRCPFCNGSLKSLLPSDIYFIEIGDVINGDHDDNVWVRSAESEVHANP